MQFLPDDPFTNSDAFKDEDDDMFTDISMPANKERVDSRMIFILIVYCESLLTVCPVAETFGDYISKFSQFGDYISNFGQISK